MKAVSRHSPAINTRFFGRRSITPTRILCSSAASYFLFVCGGLRLLPKEIVETVSLEHNCLPRISYISQAAELVHILSDGLPRRPYISRKKFMRERHHEQGSIILRRAESLSQPEQRPCQALPDRVKREALD